jgi:hypothetical protein
MERGCGLPELVDRSFRTGSGLAGSWATDGHKWLSVPYDSGIVIVNDPKSHRQAMTISGAYLVQTGGGERDPFDYVPRRAIGSAVTLQSHCEAKSSDSPWQWATLRTSAKFLSCFTLSDTGCRPQSGPDQFPKLLVGGSSPPSRTTLNSIVTMLPCSRLGGVVSTPEIPCKSS